MLFNSLTFIIFFTALVPAFFLTPLRYRRYLLLVASYFFYAAWRWPYVVLLLGVTVLGWACALLIASSSRRALRTLYLVVCVAGSLSVLAVYKYLDFSLASLEFFSTWFGHSLALPRFDLILPLGISFFTFQTIGYAVDVYRGQFPARRSLVDVALFVSFFPQLVAGPIMRADHLMTQLERPTRFESRNFLEGMLLIVGGMIRKVIIADSLAPYVEAAYGNAEAYSGLTLLLATYAFAFQIYCDFGGYSDIARGTGKVLGYDVLVNFNRPYFSSSLTEFWHRWHISLSTWLRDYLYIPLGGSRCSRPRILLNLMITMVLGGLWHGANWTFVLWGTIHGAMLVAHRCSLWARGLTKPPKGASLIGRLVCILATFNVVCLAWVFFRATDIHSAFALLARIVTNASGVSLDFSLPILLVGILLLWELLSPTCQIAASRMEVLIRRPLVARLTIYVMMLFFTGILAMGGRNEFIYFQF